MASKTSDGEDCEIKLPQLLFVDLAGKHRQLRGVLQMPVHGGAMLLHFPQQDAARSAARFLATRDAGRC